MYGYGYGFVFSCPSTVDLLGLLRRKLAKSHYFLRNKADVLANSIDMKALVVIL